MLVFLSPIFRLCCLYLVVEVLYELLVLIYPPLAQDDDEVVEPVDCSEVEVAEEIVVVANGWSKTLKRQQLVQCQQHTFVSLQPQSTGCTDTGKQGNQQSANNDDSETEDDSDLANENKGEESDGEQQVEKLVVEDGSVDVTRGTPDPSKPLIRSIAPPNINSLVENHLVPPQRNELVVKMKEKTIARSAGNSKPASTETNLTLPNPEGLQNEGHGQEPVLGPKNRVGTKNRVHIKPHAKEWPLGVGDYQPGVQQDEFPRNTNCIQCSDVDVLPPFQRPDITIPK
ncbi:uncharacterized protein [Dysidea avara]|uniref:uncharacterized protein isoform X2 n=1 Tax=Dysidea avara TaxID=196820 RepID=UPI003328C3B6